MFKELTISKFTQYSIMKIWYNDAYLREDRPSNQVYGNVGCA